METTKHEPYSVYHTFSQNIPSENLPASDKKFIAKESSKTLTESQQIAFIRLILEHNMLEHKEGCITEPPFSGIDLENEITYDINLLPKALQWILFRFTKICVEENQRQ